jgi:hypothetical protein
MKHRLKQILEQIDPNGEIFNEVAITQLSETFEDKVREKIVEAETKLLEKHQVELTSIDTDHADKMRELVEEIDEDHSEKLDIILENIEKKHASECETLIEEIDEDHSRKISFVIEKIEEAHATQINEVVAQLDADHSTRLDEVVATVNAKFNEKLKDIDLDHTAKLNEVTEYYETKHTDTVVTKVSDFLDMFIEDFSQTDLDVEDKLKLEALEGIFESVRETLGVNGKPVFLRELTDDSKIDELTCENTRLNSHIKNIEAKQLLSEKTSDMNLAEADHVRAHFADASCEDINSNMKEVVKAYKLNKKVSRLKLNDEYQNKGVSLTIPTGIVDEEILSENSKNNSDADSVAQYVDMVKKTAINL